MLPKVRAEPVNCKGWKRVAFGAGRTSPGKGKGRGGTRSRLVMPIGVIVAVAIVCVVVAVLTSARRADEVAFNNEQQLIRQSLAEHGERAASGRKRRRDAERHREDPQRLRSAMGRSTHRPMAREIPFRRRRDRRRRRPHQIPISGRRRRAGRERLCGRICAEHRSACAGGLPRCRRMRVALLDGQNPAQSGPQRRRSIQQFPRQARLSSPRWRSAPTPISRTATPRAPIVLAVKYHRSTRLLAKIGGHLQISAICASSTARRRPAAIASLELADAHGDVIARLAWKPTQPGGAIVASVLPFIAVALAGFALLVGLGIRYMRRTAAEIAAGERQLRHLALHDPVCGLPNRIFFGERLEQTINDVRAGGLSAAVFYIDLDHFKDVNDTLGHHIGDELILNVTQRLSRIMRGDDLVARLGGDEFAIITTCASDSYSLQAIAGRIIAAVCAPYAISRPQHHHRRLDRHRRDRPPRRRRRRHSALRRHGAVPRQERRPQPRLHLRCGDGRRPVEPQIARRRSVAGDQERRLARRLPADRQCLGRRRRRRRGAGALDPSDPRRNSAVALHSDRRTFRA